MKIGPKGGAGIIASERQTFSWWFIQSLLELKEKMGKDFQIIHVQTGDQATARNLLLKMAKDMELDYLVMIDSDMTFPSFGVQYLIETMEEMGANIGTGLYFVNSVQKGWVPASQNHRSNGQYEVMDSWEKPQYIDAAGMGFTLITKELFDLTFAFAENMGEDVYFCSKAKEKGYKIILQPYVKCGHLRMLEVNEDLINKALKHG